MNRRWAVAALSIALVGMAAGVAAHDGHVHKIMGTVMARDAKHIEVKTPSGENLSIAITAKTTATRDKRKVPLSEVQVGRRVVVAIGNGEDPLMAGEIQVGATRIDNK
jgi:hypothetical protein